MHLDKKVYTVKKINLVLFTYNGKIQSKEYNNFPFIFYPDGVPCNYANLYLLHLCKRNLSTFGRGGTIRQYAYIISKYTTFCFNNNVDLLDVSNAKFNLFIRSLKINPHNGRANTNNTLINNAKIILEFLSYLEKLQNRKILEERLGAVKVKKRSIYNGKTIEIETWDHPSFGTNSTTRRRSAIEKNTISALYSAAELSSNDEYLVNRRQILIRVLEITGGRISECAELKIDDLKNAKKDLMLKLMTLKKGTDSFREIPILSQDLTDLETFVVERKIAFKNALKTNPKLKDNGYLFFSTRTGRKMTGASLSNEIGLLRRLSGIEEAASAHLFRHRFVTKVIISLIENHNFSTPSALKKAFQELESLKIIVSEWTGHSSLSSLEHYIDEAFSEWKSMRSTIDKSIANRASETYISRLEELVEKLSRNLSSSELQEKLSILKNNYLSDQIRNSKQKQEP